MKKPKKTKNITKEKSHNPKGKPSANPRLLLAKFKIGDLVRVHNDLEDRFNSKGKVFEIKDSYQTIPSQNWSYLITVDIEQNTWFDEENISPATDFREGDRVLIIAPESPYHGQVAEIYNSSYSKIECSLWDGVGKNTIAESIVGGFWFSSFKLVDSLTPITFSCEEAHKAKPLNPKNNSSHEYQVGDLVRIKPDCFLDNPHAADEGWLEDERIFENSKNKVFRIEDIRFDEICLDLLNDRDWFRFSLDEIEPATEIKFEDVVIVTEGDFKDTVARVSSFKNGVAARIIGITDGAEYHFTLDYLRLVDSQTPLNLVYKCGKYNLPRGGVGEAKKAPLTDEITYLRSENQKLQAKISDSTKTLNLTEREEIYYLRDEKRNLQAKIDDLTKGLSEEKLQRLSAQNILATYMAKCPQLEKHNQDLTGQLMLVSAEVEHLLKKKLPEPRFTFGKLIINVVSRGLHFVNKCLIPLMLITALSKKNSLAKATFS